MLRPSLFLRCALRGRRRASSLGARLRLLLALLASPVPSPFPFPSETLILCGPNIESIFLGPPTHCLELPSVQGTVVTDPRGSVVLDRASGARPSSWSGGLSPLLDLSILLVSPLPRLRGWFSPLMPHCPRQGRCELQCVKRTRFLQPPGFPINRSVTNLPGYRRLTRPVIWKIGRTAHCTHPRTFRPIVISKLEGEAFNYP